MPYKLQLFGIIAFVSEMSGVTFSIYIALVTLISAGTFLIKRGQCLI